MMAQAVRTTADQVSNRGMVRKFRTSSSIATQRMAIPTKIYSAMARKEEEIWRFKKAVRMASAVAMAVIGSASERNHSVVGVLKVIRYS